MLTLLVAGAITAAPPVEYVERGKEAAVAGDLPAAVLAFRHGLAEHPGDRELGDLLEAARELIAYPPAADASERLRPNPPATWDRWVGAWELTAAGVGCAALFAVGLATWLTTRPRWAIPLSAIGLLGFLGVVIVMNWPRTPTGPVAVVRPERGSVLHTGNADSYPPRTAYPLPRGTEVTVLNHRGGWVQVQLAGSAVGWVRERDVNQ